MTDRRDLPGWPWHPLLVATVLMIAVLAGGAYLYQRQYQALHRGVEHKLEAIGRLKANQIAQWREERLGDAALLTESPLFARAVTRYLADPQGATADELRTHLAAIGRHYRYRDVVLVSPGGEVRLSLTGRRATYAAETPALAAALAERRPRIADLHRDAGTEQAHLTVVAPIFAPEDAARAALGAVLLVAEARRFLYPLVQSWPTESRTAETLLVQRDGEDVLFLNPLRHRSSAALRLRIPLGRSEVPAVQAVRGRTGVVQGRDYRGVDVVSVLAPVPGSPWFLVSKMDEAEAYAAWRTRSWLLLGMILCLLALLGAAGAVAWQRRRTAAFQALYRNEAARREAEARFRVTLQSIGDAVIVSDLQGRVELLNPAAERLTGWTHAEAPGQPLAEVFRILNEDSREPVEQPADRVLREGRVVSLANHTILVARDGTERPIADSGAPILDDQGAITGVVVVFRDQTEERQTRSALVQAETRFRRLAMAAPVAMYETDAAGDCRFVNERWCALTGLTSEEAQGRGWQRGLSVVDRERIGRLWFEHARDWKPWDFEYSFQRPGGEVRWVWGSAVPARDEHGEITGYLGVNVDITERRRAEAALKESEERYRTVADFTFDWEYWIGADHRFQYCSPACERITGYRAEEFMADPDLLVALVHPDDRERVDHHLDAAAAETTGPHELEFRIVGRSGEVRWIAHACRPVRGPDGTFLGRRASNRDVTDRKHLEERAQQSQKMEAIGQLAGGIAHDFNNLLAAIILQLDLLRLQPAIPEEALQRAVGELLDSAQRAARLTEQLLLFSRRKPLQVTECDLNVVVGELSTLLHRLIGETVTLTWRPHGTPLWLEGDAGMIGQIVMNLCVNARDAMPQGGKIVLSTGEAVLGERAANRHPAARPGRFARLTVEDTGSGMTPEVLRHLFEPFFTTKPPGQGTGLGLATVHGIVARHNGWIEVESRVGAGSTFHVYLPAADATPARTPEPTRIELPQGRAERILVVEDEPLIRRMALRSLERLGYRPTEAVDAAEGRREWDRANGQFDLLLTDMVMPGSLTGLDLCRELRQVRPDLPVIIASGYSLDLLELDAEELSSVTYLPKPYDLTRLAVTLRKCLEGATGNRQPATGNGQPEMGKWGNGGSVVDG